MKNSNKDKADSWVVTVNVMCPALRSGDAASRTALDSSHPQAEARLPLWRYLAYFTGNSRALGMVGLALLICLWSRLLQQALFLAQTSLCCPAQGPCSVPLAGVFLLGGLVLMACWWMFNTEHELTAFSRATLLYLAILVALGRVTKGTGAPGWPHASSLLLMLALEERRGLSNLILSVGFT